ncbi:MAG: hypothetical protein NTZ46_00245 [Verrucomicrobia bacterium]|nr:hypothetical protein [Verrucomicrobiota bacterium]
MKHLPLHALVFGILLPLAALAQTGGAPTPAPPLPVAGPQVAVEQPTPAPVPTPEAKPTPMPKLAKGEIRLNFQNASLSDVLNYLSETAGFIILQDAPILGNVNVVSKQPVTVEDAIDLLNSVLVDKGYTAIRNGRILKIVPRNGAQKQDLPVMTGSDPAQIPRKDGMVTQILPVRYVDAAKLVENLRPLLSLDATLTANEASNALLLADTQTNVHRIAEIVHALDTSVSSIAAIHVFPLQYADSKSLAGVLTQLFAPDPSTTRGSSGGRSGGGANGAGLPPWAAMMGKRGGGGSAGQSAPSAAQQAASRVVVVSDDLSNSLIVSAPEVAMATITDIINRIDTNIADITETRIFRLEHADSIEMANILNALYFDAGGTPSSNSSTKKPSTAKSSGSANRSERSLLQSRVVAVADPRTNSLLVSAANDSMTEIAATIGRLDSGESKKQQVYIYPLENADPDNVATILRGMFGNQTTTSSSAQPTSSQLNRRSSTGASSDISNVLNTSGNTSRTRR